VSCQFCVKPEPALRSSRSSEKDTNDEVSDRSLVDTSVRLPLSWRIITVVSASVSARPMATATISSTSVKPPAAAGGLECGLRIGFMVRRPRQVAAAG
jgi:hypothetical protein